MSKPLTKTRIGPVCKKHPELNGLQTAASYTCVQCGRDKSHKRMVSKRDAEGRLARILYTPEQAAARIAARDKVRGQKRRQNPAYNAKQIEQKRQWRIKNRERHLAVSRAYDAKQLLENPQRRISKNLRHRLYKAVLGKTTGVSAVRDLGMTILEFREYFSTLFADGMTWENYGEWQIDHIRPLASFDLSIEEQARLACHFSNLQPLWALENIRKGSRITPAARAAV